MTRKPLVIAFAAFALAASSCGSSTSTSGSSAPPANTGATCSPAANKTLTANMLTIGTDNPAYDPYFSGPAGDGWPGSSTTIPNTGKGFEAAVAYAVAKQLGFPRTRSKWTVTHFNQSFAPGPKNFDFDINAGLHHARARQGRRLLAPYYDVNQAVVAAQGQARSTSATSARRPEAATSSARRSGTTSYDAITEDDQADASSRRSTRPTNDAPCRR